MIDRHATADPFRFEGESLRYMLKDHIEVTQVSTAANTVFRHCQVDFPFPSLHISFVLANTYPLESTHVAVHHKGCKVNIPYILRAHTDWRDRICGHAACCQDLMRIQVFLQEIAERFAGTFALMAVIRTAKKDIQYSDTEGFHVRTTIQGGGWNAADNKKDMDERPAVSNPLSFLACTPENFTSWQASFRAEGTTNHHSDWRQSPSIHQRSTGKEYFELNIETKEVDWDLFADSDASDI